MLKLRSASGAKLKHPRLVPTAGVDEPAEVGKTAALEVEHSHRSIGTFVMFLYERMPAPAVRAAEFIAGLE
jgi:hypothetical protein